MAGVTIFGWHSTSALVHNFGMPWILSKPPHLKPRVRGRVGSLESPIRWDE